MTAAERAAAGRAEQGLPERVADPSTLARVVALVRGAEGGGTG